MEAIESAGVVPYRHTSGAIEFLLVKHRHGHWEFPKGKIDPSESPEQAAVRELAEEAGVVARLHEGFHDLVCYSFIDRPTGVRIQKKVHFFVGEVIAGSVTISHEHAAARWLPHKQAYTLLTHQESKNLLNNAYTFLMKC